MLMSTDVIVELMPWNEAGPDPARDRPELALADQSANLVLGATKLGRNLTDGQGGGPVHTRSIASAAAPAGEAAASG
jgi:hypothetical protein